MSWDCGGASGHGADSEDCLRGVDEGENIFGSFVIRLEDGSPEVLRYVNYGRFGVCGVGDEGEGVRDLVVFLSSVSLEFVVGRSPELKGWKEEAEISYTFPSNLFTINPSCCVVAFPGICSSFPNCFPVSDALRFITTLGTYSGTSSTSCCSCARFCSASFMRLLFGGTTVAIIDRESLRWLVKLVGKKQHCIILGM